MNLKFYGMIINLKNRIEINDEQGKEYSSKQIALAVSKLNEINELLDRRKGGKRS